MSIGIVYNPHIFGSESFQKMLLTFDLFVHGNGVHYIKTNMFFFASNRLTEISVSNIPNVHHCKNTQFYFVAKKKKEFSL